MSPTKFFAQFCFLVVILSQELIDNVNALPNPPLRVNVPKLSTNLRPPKKFNSRNARFFGKFSLLAGLGLPESLPLPIKREDLLYEHAPSRFSANYNFPPLRWGPYFAAIYEPTSTFARNPLSYIVSALNPFNWFASTTSSTSRPEITTALTTSAPVVSHSNQQEGDVVVLLQEPENEISSENRILVEDKTETQTEYYADKTVKQERIDNLEATSEHAFSDATTDMSDEYMNMDLAAEETTLKLNHGVNQRFGFGFGEKKTTTTKRTTTKKATTKTTSAMTEPTTLIDESTTETLLPTTMETTESIENSSAILPSTGKLPSSPTNRPTTTTRVTQPSFYPGYYYNGYYYGGQPQNISHLQFTTPHPNVVTSVRPMRHQGSKNDKLIAQQYQPNYVYDNYDQLQPQPFLDYNTQFYQYPTESKDFSGRPFDYLNNEVNTIDQLNGFKPSYPYYH